MRWGFGWELGPFEIVGRDRRRRASSAAVPGSDVPPLVAELLRAGRDRFRDADCRRPPPTCRFSKSAKERQRVVKQNAGASLVDLGDGVLAVEFHSKMNAIGGDTVQMLQAGLKEAAANFAALVVGNDADRILGRREPDAAAARSAGGQLGRDRPDGAAVPGQTQALQHVGRAGRRGAGRAGARRRLRNRRCTATACRRPPKPTSGWSKSASA